VDLQAGAFDEGLDAAGEAEVTELDHGSRRSGKRAGIPVL
jgi:hypothetical protein